MDIPVETFGELRGRPAGNARVFSPSRYEIVPLIQTSNSTFSGALMPFRIGKENTELYDAGGILPDAWSLNPLGRRGPELAELFLAANVAGMRQDVMTVTIVSVIQVADRAERGAIPLTRVAARRLLVRRGRSTVSR